MWWPSHFLGLDNGSGHFYLFWSGIFGDVTIFTAAILVYRKHNCHAKWCLRIGHHEMETEGMTHFMCRKHHPEHPGKVLTAEELLGKYHAYRIKKGS